MIPLHHDPWFTFRFAEARIIPRFHLDGVAAGRRVLVFKIDPGTGERLGLRGKNGKSQAERLSGKPWYP